MHEIGTGGEVLTLAPGLLLVGAGMGLLIPAIMATVLSEVDVERAGSAAAVLSTVQNVGGALGAAITGVVFFGAFDGGAGHAFGLGELQLAGVGLLVAALGRTLPRAATALAHDVVT